MMRVSVTQPFREKFSFIGANWMESTVRFVAVRYELLANKYPRIYLLTVYSVAFLGLIYLLLFPMLMFVSSFSIYELMFSHQNTSHEHLPYLLLTLIISALITYRIIRFKPAPPQTNVGSKTQPSAKLYELVDDYVRHYRSVKIDRIVFTSDFGIDVVKTQRWSLPVRPITTLVIGLPIIHCFSVTRFQCALARRIGQFSRRRMWCGNLLYQLRDIWPQYNLHTNHSSFGYQPIHWFFSGYAPIYRIISAPAARNDELAADTCAMELFSDDDVLDLITVQMACHRYLEDECIPFIQRMQVTHSMTPDGITAGTVSLVCKLIHSEDIDRWVAKAASGESGLDDSIPNLIERAHNIGHMQARMQIAEPGSAASVYLAQDNAGARHRQNVTGQAGEDGEVCRTGV
jgi:hypothetical protein